MHPFKNLHLSIYAAQQHATRNKRKLPSDNAAATTEMKVIDLGWRSTMQKKGKTKADTDADVEVGKASLINERREATVVSLIVLISIYMRLTKVIGTSWTASEGTLSTFNSGSNASIRRKRVRDAETVDGKGWIKETEGRREGGGRR